VSDQVPEPTTDNTEAYNVLVTRLERIVNELESGDLTLEQSIEKFGEGIRLAQDAGKKLDEAERRIEMLVRNADGSQEAVPFDPGKGKGQESDAG
jgi:exodeoxyribonuclease VII small subunit